MTLQIIKVRICRQCKDVLPQRCARCLKHPARRPQVLELHDLPPILKRAECGCCVQFRCQRPGCPQTLWRYIARARQARRQFCTPACAHQVVMEERKTRVVVPCGNPGCPTPCERTPYMLKTFKTAYCSRSCKHIGAVKAAHAAKKAARREVELGALALLECRGRCGRGAVTDHQRAGARYTCLGCGVGRRLSSSSQSVATHDGQPERPPLLPTMKERARLYRRDQPKVQLVLGKAQEWRHS